MEDIEISSDAELWDWLEANGGQSGSVRLINWKSHHRDKYISREAVLDALIAHGWIDGRRFKVDDDRTAQLISPRKQQAWSKSYKDRAENLRKEGRLHPRGEKAVEAGKASGLWDFFDDVDALIVPDDLAAALDLQRWDALPRSYRRHVLRWIKLAKTDKTRKSRIADTVTATARGDRLPQM